MTSPAEGSGRRGSGLPLPLVLVVISLFVLMAFETGQAIRDRGALGEVLQAQQANVDQGVKLRQQLQTLAGRTAELANAGDAAAKSVVDQMKAQGVTLSAPKQ